MAAIPIGAALTAARATASAPTAPVPASFTSSRQLVAPTRRPKNHPIHKRYMQCDYSICGSPTYTLSTYDAKLQIFQQTPLQNCSFDDCIAFMEQARYSYPGTAWLSDKFEVYNKPQEDEPGFMTKREQQQLQENRAKLAEQAIWERIDELSIGPDSPNMVEQEGKKVSTLDFVTFDPQLVFKNFKLFAIACTVVKAVRYRMQLTAILVVSSQTVTLPGQLIFA